jgi:hypothetical protein
MGQNLSILLYSSQKQASVGDIVEITIRNNVDFGLILSENVEEGIKHKVKVEAASVSPIKSEVILNPPDGIFRDTQDDGHISIDNKTTKSEVLSKKFEIKEINKILPIKLTREQIQFIKIFADNTFNSLNDTWDTITQPYNLLTQKQWKELQEIADLQHKAIMSQSTPNNSQRITLSNNNQNTQNDPFIEAKKSDNVEPDIKNNENVLNSPKEDQKTPKVEFLVDFDIIVRIMYIIRSLTGVIKGELKDLKQGINRQLLIVLPEKKYLNKVYKSIFNEISHSKELSQIVEILYYASEPTKKPKECVWSMLNFGKNNLENLKIVEAPSVSPKNLNLGLTNNSPGSIHDNMVVGNKKSLPDRIFRSAQDDGYISKPIPLDNSTNTNQTSQNVDNSNQTPRLQIIVSTRSGLFLPFTTLTDIILVDEGNSMYIQDQNSLYYDSREAIFLISKALNANISFISPLPSIRLYNMYDKQALKKQMTNYANIIQKRRKIKITRFDKKTSKYDLFGYEIEQILEKNV